MWQNSDGTLPRHEGTIRARPAEHGSRLHPQHQREILQDALAARAALAAATREGPSHPTDPAIDAPRTALGYRAAHGPTPQWFSLRGAIGLVVVAACGCTTSGSSELSCQTLGTFLKQQPFCIRVSSEDVRLGERIAFVCNRIRLSPPVGEQLTSLHNYRAGSSGNRVCIELAGVCTDTCAGREVHITR